MTSTVSATSSGTSSGTTTSGSAPFVADVIDVGAMQQMMREDPLVRILDVRTGAEFDNVHIPGSFNVPLDTLGEHVRDLAEVEHPVVLVCMSGGRASIAHGQLSGAGKTRLHILEGGVQAWESAGAEVVRNTTQKWVLDRQVRLVAGSLVLAGVVASIAVPRAKWLSGAVASGLVFSAVSNTCAMGNVLAKLPYNQSDNCDVPAVLAEMRQAA